jgi:hypothetical protein
MHSKHIYLALFLILSLCAMRYAPYRDSSLIRATRYGDISRAAELLREGADTEAYDLFRRTPFLIASASGHYKMLLILYLYGADIFAYDLGGNNALDLAVINGKTSIVPLLLRFGLDGGEATWNGQALVHKARLVVVDGLLGEIKSTRLPSIPEEKETER